MNYTLIPINNHLIIVSDEIPDSISKPSFNLKHYKDGHFGGEDREFNRVVIASTDTSSLPSIILSDEIAKEIGWIDVESIWMSHITHNGLTTPIYGVNGKYVNKVQLIKEEFINGFKTAQSLNTLKYSEEDIMTFYRHVKTHTVKEALDYINKPKQYKVELKMEEYYATNTMGEKYYPEIIKLTNGSVKVIKLL